MYSIAKNFKKLIIPQTLQVRFVLIIILPVLLGQLLATHLFYQRHWYNVINHNSRFIVTEISSLLNSKQYLDYKHHKSSYLNLKYQFIPDASIPKQEHKLPEEISIFQQSLKRSTGYNGTILISNRSDVKLYLPVEQGVIIINLPYKSLFNPTTYIFIIWLFCLTILLLSVSLIFSKNQIKSIIVLTKALEKYGLGIKEIYKPFGATEIRKAGVAFLKMRDKIERHNSKRTQMLAMISHDLKTPLTRMRLQVELLEKSEDKTDLLSDISIMQHTISGYLDFARGEGGEEFTAVDLSQWINNFIKNSWSNSNIIVNSINENIPVHIKHYAFRRAVTNIIDNALKYATKIVISTYTDQNDAILLIEDNGKGIEKEERLLVFKVFYRAKKSRTLGDTSSVGLGLAITKEIILGHYGSISLDTSPKLQGLLVKVKLPIRK